MNNRLQRASRDVLHIQQAQLALGQGTLIVDADDMVVVELGERLRLGAGVGRHFEGYEPLHRSLPREKYFGKGAAAQLDEQIEVVDRLAGIDASQPALLVAFVKRRRLVRFEP